MQFVVLAIVDYHRARQRAARSGSASRH
jgi:hypothetical protein